MITTVKFTLDDGIGRLHLDHPPLNILTRQVLKSIREHLHELAPSRELRVLLLTAEGKHFSAGADVGEHMPPEYQEMIPEFLETIAAVDSFPLPVIAAVQGRCLGGGFELVQPADIIVAGESASFGQPEIVLGVLPPAACVLLPELCPAAVAAELVLSGDAIEAREAERVGLVRRVVPDASLLEEATGLARRIARHSGAALRLAKRALRGADGERRSAALSRTGGIYVDELMATSDAVEGLHAFMVKREPVWTHE